MRAVSAARSFLLVGLCAVVALGAGFWWNVGLGASLAVPGDRAPVGDAAAVRAAVDADRESVATPAAAADRDRVAEAPVVRGRLLGAGQPLAGAAVVVHTQREHRPVEIARTATDASGAFELPMPTQGFYLTVDSPAAPRDWRAPWQQPRTADLALGDLHVPAPMRITGTVHDERGQPVAMAEVLHARSEPSLWWPCDDPRAPFATHSERDGRFEIDRVMPGDSHLKILADGFAVAKVQVHGDESAPQLAVDVELSRGVALHGFVHDWCGRPLPGALVCCGTSGREVRTDAVGRFDLPHHRHGDGLRLRAQGHVELWIPQPEPEQLAAIRLERAVTLRGVVQGAGGAGATVQLDPDHGAMQGGESARPDDLMERPLPTAPDGSFVIEGVSCCHYVVTAKAPGVGASAPLHLALASDTTIELVIERQPVVRLVVRDDAGAPVAGAEVVFDPELNTRSYLTQLYQDGDAKLVRQITGAYARRLQVLACDAQSTCQLTVAADTQFAFVVRAPGFLTIARLFAAGELPAEVEVTLQRAGRVFGSVRGGSTSAYDRTVAIWHTDDDARLRARATAPRNERFEPRTLPVDAAGTFAGELFEPGTYRAALSRDGGARAGTPDHEQVGRVPLIDGEVDLRAVAEFTIVAGQTTRIELDEPPLGVLRGRVLLDGRICAQAAVFAARPGWRFPSLHGDGSPADWDEDLVRDCASGQRVDNDGSFRFLYRDAGPVELRVRHANGAATSAPVVVTLPPPGDDVVQDLDVPLGTIRGSFDTTLFSPRDRPFAEVVLFPLHKAAVDPFCSDEWSTSVAWNCARQKLAEREAFVFDHLPDGDYVVRVCRSQFDPQPVVCQRVVTVRAATSDLGRLQADPTVTATVRWSWSESAPAPGRVRGVWVRRVEPARTDAIWWATWGVGDDASAQGPLPAGRYQVVPFGWRGAEMDDTDFSFGFRYFTGQAFAEPVACEVHADGTTTPAVLPFTPKPAAPR